ncbi:hypothetical protein J1614_006997 [Plenodomus biglobosus]|nr:hypothetical protein J1614_006997 [Plenodomus biglobosus]
MAFQLPAHLSQKCALVLLPPPSITAPIEAVRRLYDRHFERWPPHINLLYPFLNSPSTISEDKEGGKIAHLKHDLRIRIQCAIKNIQPFHTSLNADTPGHFKHSSKSNTVWLGPTAQSVWDLQAALQAEFAECNALPFIPHLSVGQARSQTTVEHLQAEIRESVRKHLTDREDAAPIALSWYVDRLSVIERTGYKDRFKVIGTIELGEQIQQL